jgi:hypothetical protein
VLLVDEHGVELSRVSSSNDGALRWAIERPDEFPRLSEIDAYGDTVFNRLQIDAAIAEWRRLVDETTSELEAAWLVEVEQLMRAAKARVHTYVRFVGD